MRQPCHNHIEKNNKAGSLKNIAGSVKELSCSVKKNAQANLGIL
jgi:hypothetical protein